MKILVYLRFLGSGMYLEDLDDSAQVGRETVRSCFQLFLGNVTHLTEMSIQKGDRLTHNSVN